jgi:hypothetical protein
VAGHALGARAPGAGDPTIPQFQAADSERRIGPSQGAHDLKISSKNTVIFWFFVA